MWQIILIPGALIGAGLALVIAALLPRQPRLSAVAERIGSISVLEGETHGDLEPRVGSWVHRRLPDLPGFTIPVRDLELVGTPVNRYLYQKTRDALLLLIAPSLLAFALNVAGVGGIALPIAILGLPLAVIGWTGADRDLKKASKAAREEFSRGIAIYLELVAAERKRNAPPTVALTNAAEIGKSWVFVRIREELNRARLSGIPAWEALNQFSESIGVPELAEVARITRTADENGSSIYETLRATGKGMRVKVLQAEMSKANKISDDFTSIGGWTVAMVVLGMLMTPFLMNLTG